MQVVEIELGASFESASELNAGNDIDRRESCEVNLRKIERCSVLHGVV